MDRVDALRELLANVEAGSWQCKNPFHEISDHLGKASYDAYNGSLDAAKALHEAVLHERIVKIETWSKRYGCTSIGLFDLSEKISSAMDDNPARAWLIAILKALIAQEEETT